jgi:hypothetical protein
MHPRWVENAVREKPGMAGACNKSAGALFARDKPAGVFVVSSKMLVGSVEYQESGRTPELRMDVPSEKESTCISPFVRPSVHVITCSIFM